MKKVLFLFILCVALFPISIYADDGKVCSVNGGSVQAALTSTPMPHNCSGTFCEYEVTFVLMNSSPNYINATYVVRDTDGKEYSSARVFVEPQKRSDPISVKVKARGKDRSFVVDVIGADCKSN